MRVKKYEKKLSTFILVENWKKAGKIELYTDLSTLSTKKGVEKGVDIHYKQGTYVLSIFHKFFAFTEKNEKYIDISIVA